MKRWGRSDARGDEGEQSPTLAFEPVDDTEDTYQWRIVDADGVVVGGMRVLVDDDRVRAGVAFRWPSVVDDLVVTQIRAELERVAAEHPDLPVAINVQDPLVRHRLRGAGYTGGLRERLRKGPPTAVTLDLVEQLRTFVPHLEVTAQLNTKRALRLEVKAEGVDGVLEAGMPRRTMFVEEVAACLDTVVAVKRALAPVADGVHRVSFGDSVWGEPPSARYAGLAHGGGRFTIDSNLVFVDDLVALRRARRAQRPKLANTGHAPLPHAAVDATTAHEVWHLVDREVVGSGRDHVAFHHALGEPLGVETLEAALFGRTKGAPPELRKAFSRLALQVSPYATTNRREATAEMFKKWWCSEGDHVAVVGRFGELVEDRLGHPVHPTSTEGASA